MNKSHIALGCFLYDFSYNRVGKTAAQQIHSLRKYTVTERQGGPDASKNLTKIEKQ